MNITAGLFNIEAVSFNRDEYINFSQKSQGYAKERAQLASELLKMRGEGHHRWTNPNLPKLPANSIAKPYYDKLLRNEAELIAKQRELVRNTKPAVTVELVDEAVALRDRIAALKAHIERAERFEEELLKAEELKDVPKITKFPKKALAIAGLGVAGLGAASYILHKRGEH